MSDTPYKRRAFSKWACSLALAGFAVTAAAEVTDEQFEYSFHPYKQGGFPQVGGIKEGMTINASNIDLVKDYIDPGNYKLIKDGWWEMKVGPTYDYELHPLYIAASKANKNIGIFTHQKSSALQEAIFNNAYGVPPGKLGSDLLTESTHHLSTSYPHITQIPSEKVLKIEMLIK